jgi:hypothetical protein
LFEAEGKDYDRHIESGGGDKNDNGAAAEDLENTPFLRDEAEDAVDLNRDHSDSIK